MLKQKKNRNHMSINKSFQDISKDPDWQQLRKHLLNKWMCKPDWCCLQLRRFIGDMYKCNKNKLIIVSGYLSSSGFSPNAIHGVRITKLKNEIFMEIKKRKNKDSWY